MSRRTRTHSLLVLVAAASVALTGCSVVYESAAPLETPVPPSTSDQAAQSPAVETPGSTTAAPSTTTRPTASLTPSPPPSSILTDGRPGMVYMASMPDQGMLGRSRSIGPWAYVWRIDGTALEYQEVSCSGKVDYKQTAQVADGVIAWDPVTQGHGKGTRTDPWIGDQDSETTQVTIDGAGLKISGLDLATTDVAGQKAALAQHCVDAGQKAADLFLK